jgi:phytoene desaturase
MLTELHPPSLGSGTRAPEPDRRPHAVVIGSGFGGLAAAIRLGARGYRVTVLEALDQPGGRARVFRQDGFTFDAGPTIVTAPFLFEELWALCGRRMEDDVRLTSLDPFYRLVFDDGSTLDCCGDEEAMQARIAAFAPDDLSGYRAILKDAEAIYRVAFEKLAHVPFSTLSAMLKAMPAMAWLRADRSVHGFASRHVRDERLRTALSFHPLFIGGNPFSATAMYALVLHLERKFGVHFVHGGTGALGVARRRGKGPRSAGEPPRQASGGLRLDQGRRARPGGRSAAADRSKLGNKACRHRRAWSGCIGAGGHAFTNAQRS